MVTEAPSRGVVLITTLFTLSCIGLVLFVWSSLGGSVPLQAKGYRVTAVFPDASQLVTHADVRISGVTVGQVTKIQAVGLDTQATIEIDAKYAPIPKDVRAILRQKTLLGETFVQLTPGNPRSGRLVDGGIIPASQIGVRQPLDRLLGALDARTRKNLQDLLDNSSVALKGRGVSLNDALGALDPFTAQLGTIVKLLDHQSGNVRALVHDSATVLDTVSARDSDLAGLVNNGRAVLSTTAARNHALTNTINALPALVSQLRSTGVTLDHTAALATPTLVALEPTARYAPAALNSLSQLAPRATRLFNEFKTLIPVARRSLPAATRILKAIVPFADALNPAAANIVPVIDLINANKDDLLGSVANIGNATQATTLSNTGKPRHIIRTVIPLSLDEGAVGASSRDGNNRHNAYSAPGSLNQVANGGLTASDCRDANKPAGTTSNIPCKVQPGYSFQGRTSYYPSVQALPPPARRSARGSR
jgi:phospholipid/cholesterol/gamma-HCH transport system substrate-binding protein